MKNKLFFTLAGLILVFSILACTVTINDDWGGNGETVRGSGTVTEETRTISNLSSVELALPGTLHITMGGSESLRIEAEDNLLEYIRTEVNYGKLVIGSRQGINIQPTHPVHYYLTVTELSSILISSSGNIEADNLQSDSFSITISSSGDVSISRLDCTSLHVIISSSGNLDIQGGQVQKQEINISSSGEYRARKLESVSANVILTSSGEATIRVSDHLTGRLSSSGNINYIGNPDVNVSKTSSGRPIKVGE
jgi:hypothetical protein